MRIYLDSAPLIYLVENIAPYASILTTRLAAPDGDAQRDPDRNPPQDGQARRKHLPEKSPGPGWRQEHAPGLDGVGVAKRVPRMLELIICDLGHFLNWRCQCDETYTMARSHYR